MRDGLIEKLTRLPVVVSLWTLAILGVVDVILKSPLRLPQSDFAPFYSAAVALHRGLDPYRTDLTSIGNEFGMKLGGILNHSVDTPTALLVFQPLVFFPPAEALVIWLVLNAAALSVALILLLQPKYSGLSSRMTWSVAALALLFAPTASNFAYAQRQPILLLIIVLVMRALEDEREAAAGILLSLAIAYRAFPLLIAGYFVTRRNWRALAFMGIGLAVTGVLTLAVLGSHIASSYLVGMHYALVDELTINPSNVSLRAFIVRIGWLAFGPRSEWQIRWVEQVGVALTAIAVLFVTISTAWRRRQRPGFDQRSFCLWVVAAVMLVPQSWVHYMILLLVLVVAIVSAAERGQCSPRTIQAAAMAYLLISFDTVLRDRASTTFQGTGFLLEGEFAFACLFLWYVAAYWFATDETRAARGA